MRRILLAACALLCLSGAARAQTSSSPGVTTTAGVAAAVLNQPLSVGTGTFTAGSPATMTLGGGSLAVAAGQNMAQSMGGSGTTWTLAGTGGTGNLIVATANAAGNTVDLTAAANLLKTPRVNVGGLTVTYAGTTYTASKALLTSQANIAGTAIGTAGSFFPYNRVTVSSDALALTLGGAVNTQIESNYGAGSTQGRDALAVYLTQTAQSGNAAASIDPYYEAFHSTAQMSFNEGGTGSTEATSKGHQFALATYSKLLSGATNIYANNGWEHDSFIASGASAARRYGANIVTLPASSQAAAVDAAYAVGATSTATSGWREALSIGNPFGAWGLASGNGVVVKAHLGRDASTNPSTAVDGIDLNEMTGTDAAYLSRHFSVDPNGAVQSGLLYIVPTGSGASIGASGRVGVAEGGTIGGAAVVSGGTSGYLNTEVFRDAYHGVYIVATNTSGVVASFTVYRSPYLNGAPPANPITLTPDYGTDGVGAVTINQTWTAGTTVALQPAGGGLTINGTAGVTCAGAPTAGFASTAGIVTHC